jgi:hypothetical protein
MVVHSGTSKHGERVWHHEGYIWVLDSATLWQLPEGSTLSRSGPQMTWEPSVRYERDMMEYPSSVNSTRMP